MKAQKYLFLIIMTFSIISCSGEKKYTYKQLQEFTDVLNPLGTYFWDEFISLKGKYQLTVNESMILGRWNGFDKTSGCSYQFFPNKLVIANVKGHDFKDNPNISLGTLVGTWSIENSILEMTVFGYYTFGGTTRKYIKCTQYKINIVDISDIDPIGYSKKPMAIILIPEELRDKLDPSTMRFKPVRLARSLVSYNPLKEGDVTYGYFNHVEEMARRNLTGEQIANNPELVYEFFGNVPY